MQGRLREYFVCANTARGFVNYFPETLQGLDRVYILKGGPGCGKSTLMRTISSYFLARGEDVDHILCSSDPGSLDGVILKNRKIAVVDGTAPHVIEPTAPGALEEYVNLGTAWDRRELTPHKEEILTLHHEIQSRYRDIYQKLADAKEIHDRWEAIYQENADFSLLDTAAQTLITTAMQEITPAEKQGTACHRFFGAMTPTGAINYIEALTDFCETRYFIKGRPGTGKSTLLKKLAAAAIEKGQVAEVYHCSFDPDSLDMVILPKLKLAAFDATPPHEIFPSRESDILLDLYETGIRPGTDEENYEIFSLLSRTYRDKIAEARTLLGETRELHDSLEEIYGKAMDFAKIDRVTDVLIRKISSIPYGTFLL